MRVQHLSHLRDRTEDPVLYPLQHGHKQVGSHIGPQVCITFCSRAVVILILNLLNDHTWEYVTELDSRSKDLKLDSHSWSCVEVLDKNSMLLWVTQP